MLIGLSVIISVLISYRSGKLHHHASIEARVHILSVKDWDFKRYPVSNFSVDLLNSMYSEHIFNIMDLNSEAIRYNACIFVVNIIKTI